MKHKVLNLLVALFLLCPDRVMSDSGSAVERFVRISSDSNRSGTLRTVIRIACDNEGNDIIKIEPFVSKIYLQKPLVIPHDCLGSITLMSINPVETILDASQFDEDSDAPGNVCTLNVYSDNNTIRGFTFLNNKSGAGICLFGKNNLVTQNKFGVSRTTARAPNRYGIVVSRAFEEEYDGMDGAGNEIINNTINNNTLYGVFIEAVDTRISQNTIQNNGTCPEYVEAGDLIANLLNSDKNRPIFISPLPSKGPGLKSSKPLNVTGGFLKQISDTSETDTTVNYDEEGAGIIIAKGSSNTLIGGEDFDTNKNTIRFNCGAGILVEADELNTQNTITHNIISQNNRPNAGIDLGGDGLTPNDFLDADSGANTMLNTVDFMQAFPLVPSPEGFDRYWLWGIVQSGERLELYSSAEDSADRGETNGGAEEYITDVDVSEDTFELLPDDADLLFGDIITAMTFDELGNTSEFAQNIFVGKDTDLDGILDVFETQDASLTKAGTKPAESDSDGDGLPDAVEDRNRNGVWDRSLGETKAYSRDTDGDGISDFNETHGDGVYNAGIDTNPLRTDTDGDGLSDGTEDANHNGVWEGYLNETSPLYKDTDGDGYNDRIDRCPLLRYLDQYLSRCSVS
ncbi:MAG: right-handed parallel beta-helix repeat-containing protein [Deltaproteobacteria bacterium]|nr:right-handed parallel beta-helix repeat-containing protein [Deltaproteobacteria bacterium]